MTTSGSKGQKRILRRRLERGQRGCWNRDQYPQMNKVMRFGISDLKTSLFTCGSFTRLKLGRIVRDCGLAYNPQPEHESPHRASQLR
jgi:hypothetical protein